MFPTVWIRLGALTTTLAACSTLAACARPSVGEASAPAPSTAAASQPSTSTRSPRPHRLIAGRPTIGILVYDMVLTSEVTGPMEVFSKHPEDEPAPFNVVTLAQSTQPIVTEEGLRIVPDFDFAHAPPLEVLVVPSAYDMTSLVNDAALVGFIRERNKETRYTMSNCAGAQLLGASGVADGHKIVTWIGGGAELQKRYPALKVQDDATVTFVRDGKFFSSNGNLASYVSALELVEEMTTPEHRAFVESYLYLERLRSYGGG